MQTGSVCWVGAPAFIPTQAGARGNTDRREARQRARLLRSGALPPVAVPAVDDAALRDLRWAREATRRELKAATLRRKACFLRHALRSTGRATWRPAPRRWRSEVGCPPPAPPSVLQADGQTGTAQPERLGRLALARPAQGNTGRFAPGGEALQALRGVQGPVAVPPVAAVGDLTRCEPPRQRMHALGLTPSDYARGARRQPGGLTKTGQTQARHALLEGAWASRSPAQGRRQLPVRLEKLPPALQAIRGKAQSRLGTR